MSTMRLEDLCDDILRQMERRAIIGECVEVAGAAAAAGSAGLKGDTAIVTRLFIAKDVGEVEDVEDMVEIGGPDDLLAGGELNVTHAEVEYDNGTSAIVSVSELKRQSHDGSSRRSCTKTMVREKVREVSTKDGYHRFESITVGS